MEGFKGWRLRHTPSTSAARHRSIRRRSEHESNQSMIGPAAEHQRGVFYMDYTDLQVAQTNAACLCNLTDNAASAEIKGVEAEFELAPVEGLHLTLAGSYFDAKYKDFIESAIDPTTGLNLDSSGNRLQRTPDTQLSAGIDYFIVLVYFNV